MKRINIWLAAVTTLVGMTACVNELDNYSPPNGGLKGSILDVETNEPIPLPVQGSTGTIINLFELNTEATVSIDFYAKYDGTYENAQLFNGEYRVVVNGPFTAPCEGTVTVQGQTTFDLKATPYARIKATATVSGTTISLQYEVAKTSPGFTLSEVYGYWNFAPGVDDGSANYAGKQTVTDASGTLSFDLSTSSAYKDNLHKIQANGNKIYVRIGAKTEGQINYSPVIVLTL